MKLADKQVSTSTQSWINRIERSRLAKVDCFSELRSWVQHAILEAEEKKDFDKKGKFLSLLNDLETCPRTVSAMKMTKKRVEKP
jgi:hypothetical protein